MLLKWSIIKKEKMSREQKRKILERWNRKQTKIQETEDNINHQEHKEYLWVIFTDFKKKSKLQILELEFVMFE